MAPSRERDAEQTDIGSGRKVSERPNIRRGKIQRGGVAQGVGARGGAHQGPPWYGCPDGCPGSCASQERELFRPEKRG